MKKRKECFTEPRAFLKSVHITSVCNCLLYTSITKDVNSSGGRSSPNRTMFTRW